MILEFILFEITGIGSMLGLNSLRNIKEQCQGINRPKSLPIIDAYLRHRIGKMSKRELYLSRKAVAAIQRLSKYQAFRYLLVYFGRQAHAKGIRHSAHF